jgi:hypothetical protein
LREPIDLPGERLDLRDLLGAGRADHSFRPDPMIFPNYIRIADPAKAYFRSFDVLPSNRKSKDSTPILRLLQAWECPVPFDGPAH